MSIFVQFNPAYTKTEEDQHCLSFCLDINVAAKDFFQLDENNVREALYMSDVDLNEACIHSLISGEVLVVLFKMFDTDDRDFVSE